MKLDFKPPSIPSKVFTCEFPRNTQTSSALTGSLIRMLKPTQKTDSASENPPKLQTRPMSAKNSKKLSLITFPNHRKDYRPKTRNKVCYTEESQLSMPKIFVQEENTAGFKYSNRFQKNPKLVYNEHRKEYSYMQNHTTRQAKLTDDIREAKPSASLKFKYKFVFD